MCVCKKEVFTLISSEILKFEINKTPNILRQGNLQLLEGISKQKIKINEEIEKRAKYFEKLGIQSFDALYLACAETECEVLVTVDKKKKRDR